MRCLFPLCFCLLLGGAAIAPASPAANGDVTVTVPPVPRLMSAPTEYLLTPPVPPGSGAVWRVAQEDVLREAVFRYLFNDSARYDTRQFPVHYISVQGFPWEQGADGSKDPDAALLQRFRGSKPPVHAVSALLTDEKHRDKSPRHDWIIYCVSSFRWISDTQVKIGAAKSLPGCFGGESIWMTCTLHNGWWTTTGYISASA